jgi:hypothetical protein
LDGQPAKAITQQEFDREVLVRVSKKMEEIMAEHEEYFPISNGRSLGPIYSFDNDKAHSGDHSKVPDLERVPLPPRSPDMHRTVERSIGNLTRAFNNELFNNPTMRTAKEYMAKLKDIAPRAITAEMIWKDVMGLRKLHEEISKPLSKGGTYGGWASPKYRWGHLPSVRATSCPRFLAAAVPA